MSRNVPMPYHVYDMLDESELLFFGRMQKQNRVLIFRMDLARLSVDELVIAYDHVL